METICIRNCRLKNLESDWFEVLRISGGRIQQSKTKQLPVTLKNLRNEIKVSKSMGVLGCMNGWTRKRLAVFRKLQLAWRWYEYEAKEFQTVDFDDAKARKVKGQYDEAVSQIRAAGQARSIRG